MRINRPKSIETAKAVHAEYGSWKAAQDAAQYVDGKYVLSASKRFTDAKSNDIATDTTNQQED